MTCLSSSLIVGKGRLLDVSHEEVTQKVKDKLSSLGSDVTLSKKADRVIGMVVRKKGNCPCRVEPTPCPCKHLEQELADDGFCTCGLFELKNIALYKRLKETLATATLDKANVQEDLDEVISKMTDEEKKEVGL